MVAAIEKTVRMSMADAEARVRATLGSVGFGVLTEIDVAATLRAKLGVERTPLKILGACNPAFAHEALTIDPSLSLLLPCNVVLREVEDGVAVSAIDPRELTEDPRLAALVADAAHRLRAAIDSLDAEQPDAPSH
jgi:uncharacterized protein (DUF302 family)